MKRLPIALLLIVLSPCLARAATYYLRGDGSVLAAAKANANSCAAAASAMNITQHNAATFAAGDIITLCDTGGLFTDAILTPPTSGSAGSIITYNASGTPIIDAQSTRDEAIYNARNYITFSGLTLKNGASTSLGTLFNSGNHVTVQNCTISGGTHHGIADVGVGNNNFLDNTIYSNGAQVDSSGFFSYKAANTAGNESYIRGNTIYSNHCFGVYLISNYYVAENNIIYSNGDTAHMCNGIEIFNGDNDGYGQYNIVRYNKVYGQKSGSNNGEGIDFDDYTAYNSAYYNIVYGNDGPGITIWKANNNTVYNNTVYGNCLNSGGALTTKAEIDITSDGAGTTANNVIKNNIAFATQASTYAIYLDANTYNSAGLNITNNIWYRASGNWYYWNDGGGATLNTWNALTGVGTDLNADPTFVSTSDFRLQAASTAIGAGTSVSLTRDYGGYSVSGTPDMGAWEYGAPVRAALGGTAGGANQ